MLYLKKHLRIISIILLLIVLTAIIFRSLLFNISTNLIDWLDYPLMVWIIYQNIDHVSKLQFSSFFNSNIFYPLEGTMLFSDLLLPASALGFIFNLFSSNQILVFNLVFITTIFLNIWASWLLWRVFFSDRLLVFFGTLITAFSPYFFMEFNHFQIINLWPFLFGLYFLFKEKFSIKNALIIGLMISLEFLSSVYICVFMLIAVSIWYTLRIVSQYLQRKGIWKIFIHGALVLITFIVFSGPFLLKYIEIKKYYGIVRDPSEYITYSAHLTDYLFTTHFNSIASTSKIMSLWNSFNRHTVGESGAFPGVILLSLALLGMLNITKEKKASSLSFNLSFYNFYFIILIIVGFLFSLGPRLSVNGTYLVIPLPYYLILKFVPLVEPIRANARWMWLLFLGLNYFALLGMNKLLLLRRIKKLGIKSKKGLILVAVFASLFLMEIAPVNKLTGKKEFYPTVYKTIEQSCAAGGHVLLEYPMSRFITPNNVIENLTYRTQFQLASIKHKCLMVNGYSGYIPREYEEYENQLFTAIEKNDPEVFWQLLNNKNVKFFKLNKGHLYEDKATLISQWIMKNSQVKVLFNDEEFLLVEVFKDS